MIKNLELQIIQEKEESKDPVYIISCMKRLTKVQYRDLAELLKENHIHYDTVRRGFVANSDPEELLKTLGFKDVTRADDGVESIFDQLSRGVKEAFVSEETYIKLLEFAASFYYYSLRNSLLIRMQNPEAFFVASYTDWSKRVLPDGSKVQVKKGEKGIQIIIPNITECFNDEKGKRRTVSSASPEQKRLIAIGAIKTYKEVTGFRRGYVFDVYQTTYPTDEISKLLPQRLISEDGKELLEAVTKVVKDRGYSIQVKPNMGAVNGYVQYETQKITLSAQLGTLHSANTLIHELTHVVLHEKRQDISNKDKEIEAESVAFIVSSHFGLDTSSFSFPYINLYGQESTIEKLLEFGSRIQAAAKEIINNIAKEMHLDKDLPNPQIKEHEPEYVSMIPEFERE